MSFKGAVVAACLLGLGGISNAQIESDSMDDLGAWGQRSLPSGAKEFPTTLWRNSHDAYLLTSLRSIDGTALGPAERKLLRRLVLSPATPPDGDLAEAILAERARLMIEIGEVRAAALSAVQLTEVSLEFDAEAMAIDLDLASGQEASACGQLDGALRDGEYWLKLRAVCAVLRDNFSGAQLAIEFATSQGVEDSWIVEAIFAAGGDSPIRPDARYDTGLNIALSNKIGLQAPDELALPDRPDLAAAAALRPSLPLELRAQFARLAGQHDLIGPEERREIYLNLLAPAEYEPTDDVELALATFLNPLTTDQERVERISGVLRAHAEDSLVGYRNISHVLLTEMQALSPSVETVPYALDLARAFLVSRDSSNAKFWLQGVDLEGVEPTDPFASALLDLAVTMADPETPQTPKVELEERLIGAVDSIERESRVAGLFAVLSSLGHPLSPVARDFVVQTEPEGERLQQGHLTAIKAAVAADAVGEAVLMILMTTNGDAGRLAKTDLGLLLEALTALDAEDIARELALESTKYWVHDE